MPTITPKVSVIIPTFNRAKYVGEAIESVLTQTYQDFEIIVIDDGSTDNTREIIQNYGPKVKYFYQKNQGLSAARNTALQHAQGDYIAFLDDDDLWLPEKLYKQIAELEKNPDLGFVCGETYVFNKDGQIIDHWKKGKNNHEDFNSLRKQNFVLLLTVVVRRRCLQSVGNFDVRLKISQDYDLWLRLAKKHRFLYLELPLAKYRMHIHNISKNIKVRLTDHLRIFSKPEIISDWNFLQKKIKKAHVYYQFAELFYLSKDYANAGANYLKSIFHYPLLGMYYWPQETGRFKFLLPYRILKIYFLATECLLHQLQKNRRS